MKKLNLISKSGLLKRVFIKKGNPIYLIHFVTSRCNGHCDFCFYYTELNKNIPDELNLEEIEKITKNYGKLYQVILTGGEPYIRADLPEIAKFYYHNCGVEQLAICTNATLVDLIKKKTEVILRKLDIPINVNMSLNGIGQDHDNILHIKDAFKKFVKTYNILVNLKKKYSNLGLQITCTLSSLNEKKILSIYNYCLKNFPEAMFNMNLIRGRPKISTNVDINRYKDIMRRMNKDGQFRKNTPFGKLSAAKDLARGDLIINIIKANKYLTPCYAGQLQGVLYGNGDVSPCEILNKKIGNIKDYNYDFSALWQSNKNKEIVKFIKDTKCFCTHECFYTINMLFNPKHYPKIVSKIISMGKLTKF